MKRFGALLLILCMLAGMVCVSAFTDAPEADGLAAEQTEEPVPAPLLSEEQPEEAVPAPLQTEEQTEEPVSAGEQTEDVEAEDAVLIGDSDYLTGAYGVNDDYTRTHIASGDYGKETFYRVEAHVTEADEGQDDIIRKITTYYHTTVIAEATATNAVTGKTVTFTTLTSEEIDGDVTDKSVAAVIADYEEQIRAWADTLGSVQSIDISGELVYYYDVHDEITQTAPTDPDSDVILVGDLDELDNAYAAGGSITIETILDKHQTYKLSGTLTFIPETEPAPVEYVILEGENGSWTEGGSDLYFRASGDYALFTGVKVDGALLDPENYTSASGSTIVNLKASYLSTLAEGKHTLTVMYTNGEASTDFTIHKKAADTKTAPAQSPKTPSAPKTGDDSGVLLWTAVLIGSSLCLGAVLTRKRKGY